jgi:hypothetical protein
MKAINYKTITILSLLAFAFLLGFSLSVQAYRISQQELNSPVSRYLRENYGVNSIEEYQAKLEQEIWLNYSRQMEALASEYPEINFSQWRNPDVYKQYGTASYQPPKITPQQPFYIAIFFEPVTALQIFSLSGLGLIGLAAVPPIRKSKRLKQALVLGVVVLAVFSIGYFVGLTAAQTGTITIEPGSFTETASYVIWTDGTNVYARNGKTGAIEFSGSNACTVIQSAINALTSGGKIFIKAGTYTVTTWIDLGFKSNIVIQGEGDYTKLVKPLGYVKAETYYGRVLNLAYANGITIKDIYIESTSAGPDGDAYAIVLMYHANYCVFENVTIKQRDDGSGLTRGVGGVSGNGNTFLNCKFIGSGVELHGNWGLGIVGNGNRVIGCYFEGWGHNAIMGAPNRGIIANNVFWKNYDDDIDPNDNHYVVVANNYSHREGSSTGGFCSLEGNCTHFSIVGNVLEVVSGSGGCIAVRDSSYVVIANNIWKQAKYFAVLISGTSKNVIVEGNYGEVNALDRGFVAIVDGAAVENLVVKGNIVNSYRVWLVGAGNNVTLRYATIEGNELYGGGNWLFNFGTGCTFTDVHIKSNWIVAGGTSQLATGVFHRGNVNFATENSGNATILAGTTSVTVAHGLVTTPSKVIVTPRANIGNVWVSARNSTHITISCSTAPTEDTIVDWYAEV